MQTYLFDPNAPKKSANLRINSDLLRQAKELHLNLSQTLEAKLAALVHTKKCQQWQVENSEAIEAYNRRVEETGVFGDELRRF